MVTRHVRFALYDVTFAGLALPAATVDCWEDKHGRPQWVARVLTRSRSDLNDGELSGQTADGRALSGHALVADQQVGPAGARQTLIEFHGSGPLHGL